MPLALGCIGCDRLGWAADERVAAGLTAHGDDTLHFSGLCRYTLPARDPPESLESVADGAVAVTDQCVYLATAEGEILSSWEVGDVVGLTVWRSEGWISMETADGDQLLAPCGDADCDEFLVAFQDALPIPAADHSSLREHAQAIRIPPTLCAELGLGEVRLLERTLSRLDRERRERMDRERREAAEQEELIRQQKEELGRKLLSDRQAVNDAMRARAQNLDRLKRVAEELEEALRKEFPGVPRGDRCVCPQPVWWEGEWHGDPFALPEGALDRAKRNLDRKWCGGRERARQRWRGAAKVISGMRRFGFATTAAAKQLRVTQLVSKLEQEEAASGQSTQSAVLARLAPATAGAMQRKAEARQRQEQQQKQLAGIDAWLSAAGSRRGRKDRVSALEMTAAAAAASGAACGVLAALRAVPRWCVACGRCGETAGALKPTVCGSHWAHRHTRCPPPPRAVLPGVRCAALAPGAAVSLRPLSPPRGSLPVHGDVGAVVEVDPPGCVVAGPHSSLHWFPGCCLVPAGEGDSEGCGAAPRRTHNAGGLRPSLRRSSSAAVGPPPSGAVAGALVALAAAAGWQRIPPRGSPTPRRSARRPAADNCWAEVRDSSQRLVYRWNPATSDIAAADAPSRIVP